MDTGELGSGSFAMRISLNPDGTPASFEEAPAILDLESIMGASSIEAVFAQPEESSKEEAASALQVCPLTLLKLCCTACVCAQADVFTQRALHLMHLRKLPTACPIAMYRCRHLPVI